MYEAETPTSSLRGRVLYIENNPANLDLVRRIIGRQPAAEFIGATNGETGIELAVSRTPDVILLDIHMPGTDGFEVLEALRADERTRLIPVIALTAAATDLDKERGRVAGVFDYLTKPIAAAALLATIRRALHPAGPGLRSGKMLVIDDAPVNLAIAQRQLRKLGADCEVVDDPALALEMLKTRSYALILVDVSMPEINGVEFTRRLRAAEEGSDIHTPVIAVTASSLDAGDLERFKKAGLDGALTKPVSMTELAGVVHRWVSPVPAPPPVSPTGRPGQNPIDIERFKEILGTDDPASIHEMFDLFIEHLPGEIENLARAVALRNRPQTRDAAHRFKSASSNAAATRLAELLQRIEDGTEADGWDAVDSDLRLIKEECTRVVDYMNTIT